MATDVQVQFFSHLNGLTLSNNWGDMIRLLDTCLVNGLALPNITSASIDSQGDITLNMYADHKSLLFQIVELSGFEPIELNGKYRIKGTPTTTQLILKAMHIGKSITKIGTAKLASLGYDISFRDSADVKRAYRAKNPRAEHPFIRVDETLSDGANSYTSAYAKYAMVGLLDNMTHIDDFENPNVLQLPFDPANPSKNWKITGTGGNVSRGWSRWYWRKRGEDNVGAQYADSDTSINNSIGNFTLCGDFDSFYLLSTIHGNFLPRKITMGCGLFNSNTPSDVIPNWFLGSTLYTGTATNFYNTIYNSPNMTMLACTAISGKFLVPKNNLLSRLSPSEFANCSITGYASGSVDSHPKSNIAVTNFPFGDDDGYIRGSLKHICFSRKTTPYRVTTPVLGDSSMYVYDCIQNHTGAVDASGGVSFYLGELS